MNHTKTCSKCHKTKPLDDFRKSKKGKYGKRSDCKKCEKDYNRKYYEKHPEERKKQSKKYRESHVDEIRERKGVTSMCENKSCPQYLGIVIGERLCRHLFKDVKVMPYGFPGYDIICNKGKLIDVKTACITFAKNGKRPHWQFRIKKNKTADFFILVAFATRTDLNPLYMWVIPGREINYKTKTTISSSTIHKWDEWKKDIKDAKLCCAEIKAKT